MPESQSSGNASSMPTGGTSNSYLRMLGEEENELYNQKQLEKTHLTTTLTLGFDNQKLLSTCIGPEATLSASSSLATVSRNIDAVTKATNSYVSDPMTTASTDSVSDDTGSEDSRMNSDREPLLEN